MPLTPRLIAETKALEYLELITDVSQETHIVGSIRRLDSVVKDIDLVVLPKDIHQLWQRLDEQVASGIIQRDDKWGLSNRSFTYKGMPVELYTCDEHNRGYKLWLRTGPGDTGKFLMTKLSQHKSIVRYNGGYAWHVDYDETNPAFDRSLGYAKIAKLIVKDEWSFFGLIGLDYIAPPARNPISYGRLNRTVENPSVRTLQAHYYAEPSNPFQKSLF